MGSSEALSPLLTVIGLRRQEKNCGSKRREQRVEIDNEEDPEGRREGAARR
jgi:hypothetical protein